MKQPIWRLIIQEPEMPARRVELDRPDLVVGRRSDCDLRLHDPAVSGRHAVLRLSDGVLTIEDLGSTNGTLIDGRIELRISMRAALRSGATVSLGGTQIEVLGPPEEMIVNLSTWSVAPQLAHDGGGLGSASEAAPGASFDTTMVQGGDGEIDEEAGTRSDTNSSDESIRLLGRTIDAAGLTARQVEDPNQREMQLRRARLTLCGTGLQQIVDIDHTPFVIGRKAMPGVDLVLRHERVSSPHLVIEYLAGSFHVRDLGSSNGTRVNGVRVDRVNTVPLLADTALYIGSIHCLFSCSLGDDGAVRDPADDDRAALALVREGLVTEAEYQAARATLQETVETRNLGELLLATPGIRLTVKRWLSALRRVTGSAPLDPPAWKAVVAAASGWLARLR